jgi:hypothetical protein
VSQCSREKYICVLNMCCCRDFKEYNTDTTVKFIVSLSRDKLVTAEREGLHKFFKLQGTTSLTSMVSTHTQLI